VITNSDLGRLINSQEVQSHLRAKRKFRKYPVHKKNPLKNLGFMIKLNPYAKSVVRREVNGVINRKKKKAERALLKKEGKLPPKKEKTKPAAPKVGEKIKKKIKMNPHKKAFLKLLYK